MNPKIYSKDFCQNRRAGDPKAGSLPPAACEDGRVPQGQRQSRDFAGDPRQILLENFFPREVKAVFTDITCDFILPADAQGLSDGQKEFLKKTYQLHAEKVFTIRQVHGDKVLTVTENDLPQQSILPEADGVVTNVPRIVLSIRTADCVPIFLYDPHNKCIGLAHAGWKSSAQSIAHKTVETLMQNYGSAPSDILAALGPAIGRCCYQVGEEFETIFPDEISYISNNRFLDLPLVNKKQLLKAGVKPENIFDSPVCTVCGQDFFSFRRDKEQAGRHLSWMRIC